jgi:hypothetical protein
MDSPSELKRSALSGVAWDVYALPLLGALETLQRLPEVLRAGLAGDHLRAITNREAGGSPEGLKRALASEGLEVLSVASVEPTLEDVFLALAGD